MAEAERYTIDTVRIDYIAQMRTLYLQQTKTTTADNWPAQALYYELGFAVVDASVSFQKSMH